MLDEDEIHPLFHGAPATTEFRKLSKRIVRLTREAIETYGMVRPGGRWLVCLSGGKDSYTLLAALVELQVARPAAGRAARLQPRPGAAGLSRDRPAGRSSRAWACRTGSSTATPIRSSPTRCRRARTYCALCSRLRRGHLYRIAREEGCSAVVLGHHRDDIVETFFLNLFHGGKLAAMPPKLLNDEGDVYVLRPLAHVAEADCARFAGRWAIRSSPATSAAARTGCSARQVKRMLDEWEAKSPGRRQILFRALDPGEPEPPARPRAVRLQGAVRRHRTRIARSGRHPMHIP